MAYKKNYPKKKKRSNYKRYSRYANTAIKALRVANQVRQLVNTEFHYHDTSATQADVDYTGSVGSLIDIPQGDGDTERQGDSIRLKNFKMEGTVEYDSAGTLANQVIKIMILLDKQNKVSIPADVIESGYISTGLAPFAPKDRDKMFQTKVLAQRIISVNADKPMSRFKIQLSNINYHSQFENETTTINTNDLKLLIISNDPSATDGPNINYIARVTFVDN